MNNSQAGGYASGLAAFGTSFVDAQAENSSAQFKSQQLALDSQVSALQAQSTIQAGNDASALAGKKVAASVGATKASFASQGVVTNSGSAENVVSSSEQQGALEQTTIQSNAWREAWGLQVQSSNEMSESQMTALEGKEQSEDTLLTGGMKAIGDIESGYKSA